jgi:hypothetical protein
MVKRNAVFLAPLAVAVAALPAILVGPASATLAPSGGLVHLYQVDDFNTGNTGQVVMTGAIADHGVDNEGPVSPALNVISLSKGTFEVDLTNFGTGKVPVHVNDTNCSYEAVVTGKVPIVPGSGTGAYTGINGTFNVNATYVGILPPLTGANGPCDTSQWGSPPSLDFIEGSAVVSFSG